MKKKSLTGRIPLYSRLLLYILSFLIAAAGMLLILKSRGFYPFKENTLLTTDMREQYVNFYASLRYLFSGDNSIFFSWSRSMGGNYLGLFAYYLSSPFTWITLLFPLEKLYAAVTLITVLKIGLCGVTFSVFASHLWRKYCPALSPWYQLILLPFAVAYALSSYNMAFAVCLMWLDGVILLPIVLLGVEKLLDGQKSLLYFLALTALFICNYYTGYMAGLFTAVYLLFRLAVSVRKTNVRQYANRTLRFTLATLLSVGVSAPLLLPVVRELAQGRLTSYKSIPPTLAGAPLATSFSIFTNGFFDGLSYDASPHVYCGYLALALMLVFFLLRRISVREKIASGAVLLFLLASFYFVPLNLAWHGFTAPMWFPYRHTFVFIFFILYLAVRAVCALPVGKLPSLLQRRPLLEGTTVVLLLLTALDLGTNGRAVFYGIEDLYDYATVTDYTDYLAASKPLVDEIQKQDKGFYRVNEGYYFSKNDAMLLGFNGLTHYSSTYNPAVLSFTGRMGFAQEHFWNTGFGSTPLTDSLFSVKYVLDDGPLPAFYTRLGETDRDTASYRNDSALPIAYSAPLTDSAPDLTNQDPFVNQNTLLNSIAGTEQEYFTPLEFTAESFDPGWSYSFTADSYNPVYLYMFSYDYSATEVTVNGEPAGDYFLAESKCILCLGSFAPGQEVIVEVAPSGPANVNFAVIEQLQIDLLQDTLNSLCRNGMQIDSHRNGSLQGTITVPEGEKIVTSIPYDEGWTVKVDGKKVPLQKYADTFLAVETTAGEHSVSFSYVSPGFGTGLVICIISLCLGIWFFRKFPAEK